MQDKTIITVFGSARAKPGDKNYEAAYKIGYETGKAGWTLCNGGYGGTMEASAKGAKDAGGKTIGITCSLFSRRGANQYIDTVIESKDLFERLTHLIDNSDGYIILPGGSGTLVELAFVWEYVTKKLMPSKPIILMDDFWESVVQSASTERPESKNHITFASTPEEAVIRMNQHLRNP